MQKASKFMKDLTATVVIGVIIGFIVKTYLFGIVIVQGASMENTLHTGDIGVVSRMIDRDKIERGSIVTLTDGYDMNFIKRVIGVSGDKVSIKNDTVYVNGKPLKEGYIEQPYNQKENHLTTMDDMEEVTVPEGYYFVMGDNRLVSFDSRNGLGLIDKDNIIGKLKIKLFKVPINE